MDMKIKRANYIKKSNTINPEFSYTHPRTKNEVNLICNNHFTGGQLRYFLEYLAKTRQLKLGQFTMTSQQIRLILVDCLKEEN